MTWKTSTRFLSLGTRAGQADARVRSSEDGGAATAVSRHEIVARRSRGRPMETMQDLHNRRCKAFFTVRFHFTLLAAVCLSWSSVQAQDYKYPYQDPYLATAPSAILNADDPTPRLKRQVIHVPGLPGRNQLRHTSTAHSMATPAESEG